MFGLPSMILQVSFLVLHFQKVLVNQDAPRESMGRERSHRDDVLNRDVMNYLSISETKILSFNPLLIGSSGKNSDLFLKICRILQSPGVNQSNKSYFPIE